MDVWKAVRAFVALLRKERKELPEGFFFVEKTAATR